MSNLVEHAQRELELIGQFEEDPRFAQSVVAAVAAFASYPGHSGSSAEIGAQMLHDLLNLKNLAPLTDDPTEWELVGTHPYNIWQNRRNGACFSKDGGTTYYDVNESKGKDGFPIHQTKDFLA